MREVTSVEVLVAAMSLEVELAAPVVLVEPAPAAPVVPEVLVVSLAIVLLVLGCCAVVSVLVDDELVVPVPATVLLVLGEVCA
jgi:hypothetical protein